MGLGLIVEDAARAAKEGKSPRDIVQQAELMGGKVYTLFAVDTLKYLFKGGRISGSKRLLGTALNIKPILHFKDGLIQPLSQARSKKKAYARILDIIEERLGGNQMIAAAVMDVDAQLDADNVAELLRQRFGPGRLDRAGVSPVVGTHVGPGTVGISFYPVKDD
jgi:DegV family protein with EDD domain